nr:hypothetical protein [Tanacetum cinerariifolium]
MILDLVQNGPLVCPTITKEDGITRKKTYVELLLLKSFKLIAIAKLPISFFKAMAFLIAVASLSYKGNDTSSGGNNAGGHVRVVKCYNYEGESHMASQFTHPKRPRNVAWFKEKEILAEAQEAGQILDEDQLAYLADPGIPDGYNA